MHILAEDIIAFVARETGIHPSKLTLSTRLLDDLGIDGDDAVEFFEHFEQAFGVDLSDFPYYRHFGPEGWDLFAGKLTRFIWHLFNIEYLYTYEYIPITIEDLIVAAHAKRWVKNIPDRS